jgi:hypothetical protein
MNSKKIIHDLYIGFLHRQPEPGAIEHWQEKIDSGWGIDQVTDAFLQCDEFKMVQKKVQSLFVPPGHFYSPIVNPSDLVGHICWQ